MSICSHMMAYGGRDDGLFRGAILQSGGAFPLTGPNTTAFQSTFDSLITNTSCISNANSSASLKLDCIRALPLETFRASVGSATGQSIDGDFIRTSIQRALPAGDYVKVATIVGCESDSNFARRARADVRAANTDEGTTSAPTGMNTTQELLDPVCKYCGQYCGSVLSLTVP